MLVNDAAEHLPNALHRNSMSLSPVAAVMVHVSDVETGLAWYRQAFPSSVRTVARANGFEFLAVDGVQLEIVLADEKVASGAAGSVVYWHVANFDAALAHLHSIGAVLYRGPMQVENGLNLCQVRDPWGNCIGIRGL
nr:VOC family protein [uncultured Roseateles sp.]